MKPAKRLGLLLLGACFVYLITLNLDVLPGLHGDEAWVGLRARRILLGEPPSIHGMNGYTGAAFPYLVAASFRIFGLSVGSLRGVGAALNLVTIGILAATAAVIGRGRGLFGLLFLIGGSTLMTSKTRVAWELTACGPVLAALGILLCTLWLRGDRGLSRPSAGLGSVAVFVVNGAGVYNHFLFIAFAAALFAAVLLTTLHHVTERAVQLLVVQAVSMINVAVLAGAKLLLFSTGTSIPYVGLLVVIGLVVEGVFVGSLFTSPRSPVANITGWLSRHALLVSRAAWGLIAMGAAAFAGFHLFAFVQTLANEVVLARLYSETMRPWLLEASFAFAVLLLVLYFRALEWAFKRRLAVGDGGYFLVLLPACCAAALPLVVTSNTIRYYMLPNLAFVMGVWVGWLTLSRTPSCVVLAAFIGYAAWLNVHVVRIVSRRDHYDSARPVRVDLGLEDFRRSIAGTGQRPAADPAPNRGSAHFLSTLATFERTQRDGVTEVETTQPFFIRGPLEFYGMASPNSEKRALTLGNVVAGGTAVINYDERVSGGLAYSLVRDAGGP